VRVGIKNALMNVGGVNNKLHCSTFITLVLDTYTEFKCGIINDLPNSGASDHDETDLRRHEKHFKTWDKK
jgi:hypothetical protein